MCNCCFRKDKMIDLKRATSIALLLGLGRVNRVFALNSTLQDSRIHLVLAS